MTYKIPTQAWSWQAGRQRGAACAHVCKHPLAIRKITKTNLPIPLKKTCDSLP